MISTKRCELVHSSIFTCGFPRAAAHFGKPGRIAAKLADGGGDSGRIVRIGRQAAAGFDDNARRVALRRGDRQHRPPRRENRIELARNDHALEARAAP